MAPSMVQMGINTPQKGSASSGRGLMRATSRMAGPTSEFLALFLEASGKKETPISANSQKDMRDMNRLLPNKASCLFTKYFKRDGQAYPLTTSFSHHCRGRFLYSSAQTTSLYRRLTAGYAGLHLLTATAGAAWYDFSDVDWTHCFKAYSAADTWSKGCRGADVHTVGHTDACALVWLCEKPAR